MCNTIYPDHGEEPCFDASGLRLLLKPNFALSNWGRLCSVDATEKEIAEWERGLIIHNAQAEKSHRRKTSLGEVLSATPEMWKSAAAPGSPFQSKAPILR